MENPKIPTKALAMSDEQWKQNKLWLLQFPPEFCMPVIKQLERYLFEIPTLPPNPLKGDLETSPVTEVSKLKPPIKKN